MDRPAFSVTRDGPGRFMLHGELDMAGTDGLLGEVEAEPGSRVLLDCRDLLFIDSAGIRALLQVARRIDPGELILDEVRDNVRIVLDIVRLDDAPNVTLRTPG